MGWGKAGGLWAVGVLVGLAATVTIGMGMLGSSSPVEVLLEPAGEVGPDPFLVLESPSVTVGQAPPLTLGVGVDVKTGIEPGLYGGSGSDHLCDPQLIADFLAGAPDKASAWADAAGIELDEIGSFLERLTPVRLLADALVTNHGFRDGVATPRQSVLQAGTMVLVDDRGVPRVRCKCGNPLQPPQLPDDRGSVTFVGPAWDGFDPDRLLEVEAGEPVEWFEVIDVDDGRPVARPVGTVGDQDAEVDESGAWVPSVDLQLPADASVGDGPYDLPPVSSAGAAVEYATTGPCRVVADQLVLAGEGRCVLVVRSASAGPWAEIDREYLIEVARLDQEIRVAEIDSIDVGGGPADLGAVADSLLPVSAEASGPCTIVDDELVPLGAGTCTITLTQPGDARWAEAPPLVVTIEITDDPTLLTVTITLDLPSTVVLGADPLTLAASTSPDRPVGYVVAGSCTLDGVDRLVFDTAGECEVVAVADGDDGHRRATTRGVVTVLPRRQTLGLDAVPRTVVLGPSALPLPATSSAGLTITYEVSGPCRLTPAGLQPAAVGTCQLDASAPGNAETEPVSERVTITIEAASTTTKRSQTITFAQPAALVVGGPGVGLDATSSAGLPVTLTVTGGDCRLRATTLDPGGAGTCTVVASQVGDAEHEPADPVTRVVTVARRTPTLTLTVSGGPADRMVEGERRTVTGAVSSGPAASIGTVTGSCTRTGPDQVTATATAGTCVVTVASPGDADHEAVSATATIAVRVRQQIDLRVPVASIPVGDSLRPVAASSAGLPVTLSAGPAAVCTISEGEVVGRGAGRCTITADAPANDQVTAATASVGLDVVSLRVPTVTIDGPVTLTVGEVATVTATSSEPNAVLTISFAGSACAERSAGVVVAVARGTCTITASHPATPGAEAGSAQAAFEVVGRTDAIDFDCIGPCELSPDQPGRVVIVTRSGLVPTASVSGPCVIIGERTGDGWREVTIDGNGVGTCSLRGETNGDGGWEPASALLDLPIVGLRATISFDLGPPIVAGQRRSFEVVHDIPTEVVEANVVGSPTCTADLDPTGRKGTLVARSPGLCRVTITVSAPGYVGASATDETTVVGEQDEGVVVEVGRTGRSRP